MMMKKGNKKIYFIHPLFFFFFFFFLPAICVGDVRVVLLPDLEEGVLLPLRHPPRQELRAQDRRHPGHPLLSRQLVLQHLRSTR